ncbi:MAG: ribonuclease P protein component, partial [Polaribacter sp.]
RNFKKAPDRNRLKRVMRESYRLQKEIVYNNLDVPYVFMISYLGKEEKNYEEIYAKMNKLLSLFIEDIQNISNEEHDS